MEAKREEKFQLRGKDSWIHCLEFDRHRPIHTPYHFHGYVELLYFYEGEGTLWVSGEQMPVSSGMLCVISAQRAHRLEFLNGCRYICVKLEPEILYADAGEYGFARPFLTGASVYVFPAQETEQMQAAECFRMIMAEWNRMDYGFEMSIRSQILRLFVGFLRSLQDKGMLQAERVMHPQIMASLKYIRENLDTVTAESAAESCALSYHYYSRMFAGSMGMHFNAYVNTLRLFEAEKLLLSTERSVTDIALICGFSGSSHFIARFKAAKGISPARYRRQHSKTL